MGKSLKKRGIAAKRINKNTSASVLTNPADYIYGRVVKPLGFCTFEILVSDGRQVHATLPGTFKKTIYISAGNIVVLEDSTTPGLPLQIKGILARGDAYTLYKKGLINKSIIYDEEQLEEEDLDGFEFDLSNDKEDEIDVDAI
jgi:translation initiation factor IF-1